jgi:integrase
MKSFSNEELRALLEAAKAKRHRDWLMILVTFNHGLRASEILNIQRKNIQDGYLVVQRLKGSLKTVQPLVDHPDPLFSERQALIEYAAKSMPGRPIFPLTRQRFWQLVREYGKTAGIATHKCFPHALKHTIAVQGIHSAGVENVRQYLGHKSLSSTGEYLRVSDEQASDAMKKALGSL